MYVRTYERKPFLMSKTLLPDEELVTIHEFAYFLDTAVMSRCTTHDQAFEWMITIDGTTNAQGHDIAIDALDTGYLIDFFR